jgi:subtilase family serine protease
MQLSTPRRVLTACAVAAIGLLVATAAAQQIPIKVGGGGPPIQTGSGTTTSSGTVITAARMPGVVVVPPSSVALPADRGKKAHTNFSYIAPGAGPASSSFPPPFSGYPYETPGSLACLYRIAPVSSSACNPLNTALPVATGGSQKIAIVDAFDDPEAAADLAYYSDQFGLPFSVSKFNVYQVPSQFGYYGGVDFSGGWEIEESLDIEMAHAMAPNATIWLFESYDNTYTELLRTVQTAINWIQCGNLTQTPLACGSVTGKGEISMSWGGGEFLSETAFDSTFNTSNSANVVFFASAGDSPGPIYPSTSPYVVAVGGTTVSRSQTTGNFLHEVVWSDGGGGVSTVEPVPTFQSSNAAVHAIVGSHRGTPDVSAVANPYTGVYVYDTFPQDLYYYGDWWIIGGTSASSPIWAGIVNNAAGQAGGAFAANTQAELTKIYNNLTVPASYAANFRDINYGVCGYYMGATAVANWDICSGAGAPQGFAGK